MRFSICLIPAFILLLSAAGCNCCYQPGYYDPNGLAYAPMVQPPALKPIQRPAWLGGQNKKHDPAECPLCNAHASTAPHPIGEPVPMAPHEGEIIHNNGGVSHTHGPEGFHQHSPNQPVELNGIIPTSHSGYGEPGVQHAGYESRGCGCGNSGCRGDCKGNCGHARSGHSHNGHSHKGQCGADRHHGQCGATRHKPNCSGANNCGCGGATSNCGCGTVSCCDPCITCDVVEGFPISGSTIDSGCSSCAGGGITMGSVIPGTIIDGGIASGNVIPGGVISDGVIFDGAIVDGDAPISSKPCETCGKVHTTVKPVPETGGEATSTEESVPGRINPGTLKPQTPQNYDGKTGEETPGAPAGEAILDEVIPGATNPVPPAREPSAINEPEALPGSFPASPRPVHESLTPTHPPAGAPRARTTPSSWRTTSPRPASPFSESAGEKFRTPVHEGEAIEPATLMIPTIPDGNGTRHVHWVPEND